MGHAHSSDHSSVKSQAPNHKQSKTKPLAGATTKDKENDSKTKSRKLTRLGTIRRKLAKSLKTGKNSDYSKHMRGMLQNWTTQQIQELVNQYEQFDAIKKLSQLSDAAKPVIGPLQQDFLDILVNQVSTDLVIEYNKNLYYLHKSIVYCRCKFFAKYLAAYKNGNEIINFEIPGLVLDSSIFTSLLRYIYSGVMDDPELQNILTELTEKFGVLNDLVQDLTSLSHSINHTDVLLVYRPEEKEQRVSCQKVIHHNTSPTSSLDDNPQEILCHSAVLNARSTFFRTIIMRKLKERQNSKDPVRIVLNEKILPQCYIQAVLKCMYTDTVDLSSVVKRKNTDSGIDEADRLLTFAESAMELYEIGKFLELPSLVQGCEQIIVENINQLSLLGILEWSSQPHGSQYIYRQSLQYLREEFMSICKVPSILCNLPKRFLVAAIKSDYLQSTEEFVLFSIIKWGEWQIARVNGKAYNSSPGGSLPRRSPKRREHNSQVRVLISQLVGFVRFRHIIPTNSSVLSSAVQRGLLDGHVPFEMMAPSSNGNVTGPAYWLSSFNHSEYENPRMFSHYFAEARIILNERLSTDQDGTHNSKTLPSKLSNNLSNLPDMLPRDDSFQRRTTKNRNRDSEVSYRSDRERAGSYLMSHCELDEDTIRDMVLMEKELKMSPEVILVMSLVPDCKRVSEEIQLRVVRRFGLPDEMASEVFGQAPDLVESGGSSYSSRQNTLSRVGRILQEGDGSPGYSGGNGPHPSNSLSRRQKSRRTNSLRSTTTNTRTLASSSTTLVSSPRFTSHTIARISTATTRHETLMSMLSRPDNNTSSSRGNVVLHARSPLDLQFLQESSQQLQQERQQGTRSLPRDLPNVLQDT